MIWRGGRVVECTALEMRHTGNRIGGSNPSLSASLVNLENMQEKCAFSAPNRHIWGENRTGRVGARAPFRARICGFSLLGLKAVRFFEARGGSSPPCSVMPALR